MTRIIIAAVVSVAIGYATVPLVVGLAKVYVYGPHCASIGGGC